MADIVADLQARITAHGDRDGYCANGCNLGGWIEPHPCPARREYEAALNELHTQPAPTGPATDGTAR